MSIIQESDIFTFTRVKPMAETLFFFVNGAGREEEEAYTVFSRLDALPTDEWFNGARLANANFVVI